MYRLHCFSQSGNCFKVAFLLRALGQPYESVYVDYLSGITRDTAWRGSTNEMGEAPVLAHGGRKLTQSGVILTYLARRSGKYLPQGEDEELEALRWIIFDNQKINGFLGPYRFLRNFAKPAGDPAVLAFFKGRIDGNLAIVNKRLDGRKFLLGDRPTIADVSLAGYFYYPPEEFGFDIGKEHPAIGAWRERIQALPGWAHPYDLMPGHPLPT